MEIPKDYALDNFVFFVLVNFISIFLMGIGSIFEY